MLHPTLVCNNCGEATVMGYAHQTNSARLSSGVGLTIIQESVCVQNLVSCTDFLRRVAERLGSVRWV